MPDGAAIVARGKAKLAGLDMKVFYFLSAKVFIPKTEKKTPEQGMKAIGLTVGNCLLQEKVCFFAITHDCSRLRHLKDRLQIRDGKFLEGCHDGNTAYGFSGKTAQHLCFKKAG